MWARDKSRTNWPLVIFRRSRSFSQDAKEASRASVIFLLVPGVNGGTCAGISEKRGRHIQIKIHFDFCAKKNTHIFLYKFRVARRWFCSILGRSNPRSTRQRYWTPIIPGASAHSSARLFTYLEQRRIETIRRVGRPKERQQRGKTGDRRGVIRARVALFHVWEGRLMLLLTGEVRARVQAASTLRMCARERAFAYPTCVRCRARPTSAGNGEASKSETAAKGARIAILDSIVIKRGATAAAEQAGAGASPSSSSIVVVTPLILWCLRWGEREMESYGVLLSLPHRRPLLLTRGITNFTSPIFEPWKLNCKSKRFT